MKLDKLIKDSKLVERLDKLDPDTASGARNDGINYWKGKKIITLAEWKRKIGRNGKTLQKDIEDHRIKEALQYFPDDYDESLFPSVVSKELIEVTRKWKYQYLELMQFRRNSKCSRLLCFSCLLCPDKETGRKLVGISKLIAKAIEVDSEEEEVKEDDNSNSPSTTPTTTAPSLYPCSVLNRFKCPYDRYEMKEKPKYQQQHLVRNGEEVKEEVDSNSSDIDVDYLFSLSGYAYRVELAFIKAKKEGSAVAIKNVEDIYNALTDRETLDKLLQQDLDGEQLEYKDEIVKFFMSIKNYVRIEDLTFYKPTDA